jgi:hypothetical protein
LLQQLLEQAITNMQNSPFPLGGVSLDDLDEFIASCGGEDALSEMTTEMVVEDYIKAGTKDKLSYCNVLAAQREKV